MSELQLPKPTGALAEAIADACLADQRVLVARIRVEKIEVMPDAASAGVEIERRRVISGAGCPLPSGE